MSNGGTRATFHTSDVSDTTVQAEELSDVLTLIQNSGTNALPLTSTGRGQLLVLQDTELAASTSESSIITGN